MAVTAPWDKIKGTPYGEAIYREVYVAPGDVLTIKGTGFRPNEVMSLEEADKTIGGQSVWVKVQTLKATQVGDLDAKVSIQQRHLAITRNGVYELDYMVHAVRQNGTWIEPTNEIWVLEKAGSGR
ncbi:MAG: hypothetical protein HW384_526 [Dehalococcoidia bacterium]|nr:hypothetical protein [Dehalococcoidia bacterium]